MCVCMSTTHLSLCPILSAWLCLLKRRWRARTRLKMRKMRRRRRWRWSSRLPSTTSVWIKRRWKRWWTEDNAHLLLFFFSSFFCFMDRPSCLVSCLSLSVDVSYFAPSFSASLSPPSGGRLCCSAWSLNGITHEAKCVSLLTVPQLAEHYMSCAWWTHVSALGNLLCFYLTVRSEYWHTHAHF